MAPRGSSLALLVTRVAANHEQFPLAPHKFAILANPLDAGTHFHLPPSEKRNTFSSKSGADPQGEKT
jgi:hypothetical protein